MRAVFFKGNNHPLEIRDLKKPKPVKDQVLVKMKYAALNHRDLWVMSEQTNGGQDGIILGSDGSGIIESGGEDVDPMLYGMEVIINPSLNWGNNPVVHGDSFKILGYPDNGTFSDYLLISKKYIFEKPEHLSFAEAAAVPLSALTAYRALFSKARLRPGEKVLITGIGGSAALWTLQFAIHYKANVFVTSGKPEKLERAKQLGATAGFNYKDPNWTEDAKKAAGGFDIIIDTAGGPDFSGLFELALPGGRIVNFGRTAGNVGEINLRNLYSKQLSLFGTTMGTRDEFLSMLDFIEGRNIKPILDSEFTLENIQQAIEHMKQEQQFGKIILKIA